MCTNDRIKEIEKLEEYITEKQEVLNGILDSLEWNQESLKDDVKICCPINSEHWIPESALPHHLETCKWVQNGYVKEELKKQPPDSSFFYQKSSNVIPIQIDHSVIQKILSESNLISKGYDSSSDFPQTVDRWTVHLNPEQRLAVYNYVVELSKTSEKTKNVTLEDLMFDFERKDNQEEKPKSHLEILAEMRDYKRRRQSYRAKNVHITKKSYTEIMKEVIENQTNYLSETRKPENDNSKRDCEDSEVNRSKDSHIEGYNSDDSSRYREHHSRHREEKEDHRKHHHSKHKSSKHYSPKRKKHKDRSRSRSPSRHKHKKSHKHKRSHD